MNDRIIMGVLGTEVHQVVQPCATHPDQSNSRGFFLQKCLLK